MLDPRGFVASCNSTNFFIIRRGELWTSTGGWNFRGITQQTVLDAWRAAGRVARECDFTLAQVYAADEAFVTGTLGGVTPVRSEEHTSELQSLMRISYAVFCLKKKKNRHIVVTRVNATIHIYRI